MNDLNHGAKFQKDLLNLSDMRGILSRYNFRNGFETNIEISGSNLLNTRKLKFPEPNIAKVGDPGIVIEGIITIA